MIDIFDMAGPPVNQALRVSGRAAWSVATHRLVAPIIFFSVAMAVLASIAIGLHVAQANMRAPGPTGLIISTVSTLRAYLIPQLKVGSTDASVVTIDISEGSGVPVALYSDVLAGIVDTLLIAGATWSTVVHGTLGGHLVLTSQTQPSLLPIPGSNSFPSIVDGGTFIIAFQA